MQQSTCRIAVQPSPPAPSRARPDRAAGYLGRIGDDWPSRARTRTAIRWRTQAYLPKISRIRRGLNSLADATIPLSSGVHVSSGVHLQSLKALRQQPNSPIPAHHNRMMQALPPSPPAQAPRCFRLRCPGRGQPESAGRLIGSRCPRPRRSSRCPLRCPRPRRSSRCPLRCPRHRFRRRCSRSLIALPGPRVARRGRD
jgi:hypothetical protein